MKINLPVILLYLSSSFIFANDLEHLKIDSRFNISIFASEIDSPRQIAEDVEGRIYVGSRRSGKIFAISDTDKNGQADERILIAENLEYATGVSIYNGDLYFSEIDKIWKIKDITNYFKTSMQTLPKKTLVTNNLPNDKWHGWKWIKHDSQGNLYTNVGAPCNVCIQEDKRYATILRLENNSWDYVAKGVRNSVGFDFHPINQKLFFTDNGRDWLGDDSPSCELNKIDSEGSFFGFPFKHAKNIFDPEFGSVNSGFDYVDPILELGAHVAPTGITFYSKTMFPKEFQNNLFITLHLLWNKSKKVGYKVIRVVLNELEEVILTEDFITGWLDGETVLGRPSAAFVMSDGSMLISDDHANLIYRVSVTEHEKYEKNSEEI